jgi:glycine cleavage system H protein
VFVELPEVGRTVAAHEAVAVVESVKAASDVYAPVAGRIVEVNAALAEDPGLINREPTGGGWFFRIEPGSPAELEALMDEAAYHAFLESQA